MSGGRLLAMGMAALSELRDVANSAMQRRMPEHEIQIVEVKPANGSEDQPILHVTVMLGPRELEGIDGDMMMDALLDVFRAFESRGEGRLPVLNYVTKDDLGRDAASEPWTSTRSGRAVDRAAGCRSATAS